MATTKTAGMLDKMKQAVAGIFTPDDKPKPPKRAAPAKGREEGGQEGAFEDGGE